MTLIDMNQNIIQSCI